MPLAKKLFGSIMLRVMMIIAVIGAMTITAVVIGWTVFQSISGAVTDFTANRLPLLQDSARITATAGKMRGHLIDLMTAPSAEALRTIGEETEKTLDETREIISGLPAERQQALMDALAKTDAALNTLRAARADEYQQEEMISHAVEEAAGLEVDVATALADAVDNAYFEMVLSGEDTISQVDENLTTLLDQDVAQLTTALQARAEMNLISGLALSAVQTADPAIRSILADIAQASSNSLTELLQDLATSEQTQPAAAAVTNLQTRLMPVFTSWSAASSVDTAEIFELRRLAELELNTALDDIGFDLIIKGDDTKTANQTALRSLLDEQVRMIRNMGALDASTKHFFAEALHTALARDPLELARRQSVLVTAGRELTALSATADPELQGRIGHLVKLADPETGLAANRALGFAASTRAGEAQIDAAQNVTEIADLIATEANGARSAIIEISKMISADVSSAQTQIGGIGILALIIIVIAPAFAWVMIIKPLNLITRVTERLSQGDLAPVNGLPSSGELGRLATALSIFRNNALDQKRLQQEEKDRELADRAREKAAAEEARRREEEEEAREKQRQADEDARAQEDAARIEAQRQQEEARQAQQARETRQVVTALAQGLAALSQGNLAHRINEEFPTDYEALRHDFNVAIGNLGEVIRQVTDSVSVIGASSTEIAQASSDLSRRTESTAATLEETAAALNELTASVSSSTESAKRANMRVISARESAETSRSIVTDAVSAMGSIEHSSQEISKITSVLDDIAFQTNLLALNAGVEAARAGEAGRGFAVVASEVRALALRAGEAASQINGLIAASNSHVQNGVASVGQVSEALENIVSFVKEISENVAGISATSDEQLSGIGEINSAVGQLDGTTQKNAAMFEETAAACGALEREALQLTQVVDRFHIPLTDTGLGDHDGFAQDVA
ncbi:methyl-accepting chemotaxis protein [Thioclava sp. GXIMD2076]|uniref:methyl-accepting chemotaxis protein n=1 Tax=Thioclava sp. GXIMD2076 TaxID=3131931 RepID=UPI0030CECB34